MPIVRFLFCPIKWREPVFKCSRWRRIRIVRIKLTTRNIRGITIILWWNKEKYYKRDREIMRWLFFISILRIINFYCMYYSTYTKKYQCIDFSYLINSPGREFVLHSWLISSGFPLFIDITTMLTTKPAVITTKSSISSFLWKNSRLSERKNKDIEKKRNLFYLPLREYTKTNIHHKNNR